MNRVRKKEPSAIQSVSYFDAEGAGLEDFAGICVKSKNGRIDHIFSLYLMLHKPLLIKE